MFEWLGDLWDGAKSLYDQLPEAETIYGGDDPSFLQGLARETISPKGALSFLGAYNEGQKGKEVQSLADQKFEQEKEILALKHANDLELLKLKEAMGGGGGGGSAMAQIAAQKAIARLNARTALANQRLQSIGESAGNEIAAYTKLGELAQRPLVR